jgi:hypothetical protein
MADATTATTKKKATKQLQVRELGQMTFSAGQVSTMDIPRGYSIANLLFRLTATLSRAAGASAGVGKDLCGAQLIKRIEVRKNGREVIKALDFESMMRFVQQRKGTVPEWALSASWTGGYGALSGTTFALSAALNFQMWNALNSLDTLFDSSGRNGVTTLQLAVYWGALNDVMTGGMGGTNAYNPASGGVTADVMPVLTISVEEYVDPDALPGEYLEAREYSVRRSISASNPKEQQAINVGNMFRQFVIKTYADDVQRSDILNNVIIRSGSQVFKNCVAEPLRQRNKVDLGIEAAMTGYYLLDFCPDGHLSRALKTQDLSELIIEMDVTKQGTSTVIEIFPTELVISPLAATAS